MLQIHNRRTLEGNPKLLNEMHRDRKVQFVDRLGWELFVNGEGWEVDEYDNNYSMYIIVLDCNNRHAGSIRISRITDQCMIRDHFSQEFHDEDRSIGVWELTRFCIAPHLKKKDAELITGQLAQGLSNFGMSQEASSFVGLCYAPMLKIYKNVGLLPDNIVKGQKDSRLMKVTWNFNKESILRLITRQIQKTATLKEEYEVFDAA